MCLVCGVANETSGLYIVYGVTFYITAQYEGALCWVREAHTCNSSTWAANTGLQVLA